MVVASIPIPHFSMWRYTKSGVDLHMKWDWPSFAFVFLTAGLFLATHRYTRYRRCAETSGHPVSPSSDRRLPALPLPVPQ
jgi:hypothetical protein